MLESYLFIVTATKTMPVSRLLRISEASRDLRNLVPPPVMEHCSFISMIRCLKSKFSFVKTRGISQGTTVKRRKTHDLA